LGRHGDYFSFLGVPRRLQLDAVALERRFRDLSRQFHPDYFHNAPSAERLASLERSSYLNDAYRTLRNPVTRIEHLLAIEGLPAPTADQGGGKVPASLLEEVFALNEELDEIREAREDGADPSELRARLASARQPIEAKRAEHERLTEELCATWDALPDAAPGSASASVERQAVLTALRERLLERNYINNLLATIEKELAHVAPAAGASHE